MSRRARVLFLKGRGASHNPVINALKEVASVESVGTLAALKEAIADRNYDAVFCTSRFPGGAYADALDVIQALRPGTPVVICSLRGGDREWVKALERGAFDLLVFPFHRNTVQKVLEEALESRVARGIALRSRSLSA